MIKKMQHLAEKIRNRQRICANRIVLYVKEMKLSPLSETYPQGQCMEMDSKMGQDLCTFPSHLN
jgi:hypothetical protein